MKDMKVIGKIIKKREKEHFIIKMEKKKKVNGKMINLRKKVYLVFGSFNISFN